MTTTRSNGEHHGNGYHPGSSYPQRRPHYGYGGGSASFRGCCCCLFLLLVFLALLALAVALVVVLVVKPRKPQFDLNQVSVQYLFVAPPSSSPVPGGAPGAAYLSLNITLLFTAVNPNKVGIRYGATAFRRHVPRRAARGGGGARVRAAGAQHPAAPDTRVIVDRFNVLQADAQDLVRDAMMYDRVDLQHHRRHRRQDPRARLLLPQGPGAKGSGCEKKVGSKRSEWNQNRAWVVELGVVIVNADSTAWKNLGL
ncbi:hypothetical protein PR202_ga26302 [Eleusine coracana subsp. coracana]|uniref:Late embryogenesis abundant protein LEA-2 subgroup domain-containing protein n=1 Tax=Eleusine coracana subsp. coracana TaxID=191504 RepID=A0AAV5DDH4_ELECO|nr:hypothetical protein PR202_ga26302 [Eleusine coracana subsp. coracana]